MVDLLLKVVYYYYWNAEQILEVIIMLEFVDKKKDGQPFPAARADNEIEVYYDQTTSGDILASDAADDEDNPWTPGRLFLLRFDLGRLSQESAAELLGVHRVTWCRWESGTSIPSQKNKAQIAKLANEVVQRRKIGGFRR